MNHQLPNNASFYPNPTTGRFVISTDNMIENGLLQIFSSLGEKVFEERIFRDAQKEINPGNISEGIYFVKVLDGEKYMTGKMIMKKN